MSDLLNLNVYPTYIFIIPSTKESIKYRPFLHKEEKVLQLAKESNNMDEYLQAVKDTIKACSFNKFDVDNAPTYDIEEFFIQLRAKSIGAKMTVTLVCQQPLEDGNVCGGTSECTFSLNDVHVKGDFVDAKDYIVKLNDEFSLELVPPNYDTLSKILSMRENSEDADIIEVISTMVKSIFSEKEVYTKKDYSNEDLKTFLNNLTSSQLDQVLEIIKNTPTIVYDIQDECPKCQKQITYRFTGLHDFFV